MRSAVLLCAMVLASCATPVAQAPEPAQPAPEAMVAAIRAAAVHSGPEVVIQPLRDPMVDDLRERAQRLEHERRYPEAVVALEHALQLVPDDPALLQERAELAVLEGDFVGAAHLAHQAWASGAKLGPLCRRHWETLHQLRLASGDVAGAVSAQAQRDACTVTGPVRY